MLLHVPACAVAVTLHSYARAAASLSLGDKVPTDQGRLSFNPCKHLDAFGFLCFLFFRLGWSKPMDTRPFAYKGDRRKGELIVAVMPPAVNLFASGVFAAAAYMMPAGQGLGTGLLYLFIRTLAFQNLAFVLFNLIPVYPLDGARIVAAVKPGWWIKLHARERMAQLVLMIALCLGFAGAFINAFVYAILGFIF
jgi:Zn-dependent protease